MQHREEGTEIMFGKRWYTEEQRRELDERAITLAKYKVKVKNLSKQEEDKEIKKATQETIKRRIDGGYHVDRLFKYGKATGWLLEHPAEAAGLEERFENGKGHDDTGPSKKRGTGDDTPSAGPSKKHRVADNGNDDDDEVEKERVSVPKDRLSTPRRSIRSSNDRRSTPRPSTRSSSASLWKPPSAHKD